MLKAKKYDWKDSNMALFGSDTEKKVGTPFLRTALERNLCCFDYRQLIKKLISYFKY